MPLPDIPLKQAGWEPAKNPNDIVVPGLDTTASINDQIDYIEQHITLKLQNIDANLAKACHLMANRMLPAVKKFAISTEPIREGAKFWTSFYEESAQVRIPISDGSSQMMGVDESTTTPQVSNANGSRSFEQDLGSAEHSFATANGAVSSTPAGPSRQREVTDDSIDGPSWSQAIESPLVRLDRQLQDFNANESLSVASDLGNDHERTISYSLIDGEKGASDVDETISLAKKTAPTHVSPLKLRPKPKTPVPANIQKYIAPPSDSPSFSLSETPQRPKKFQRSPRKRSPERGGQNRPRHSVYNDSFDDPASLFDGSPPVLIPMSQITKTTGLGGLPKLTQTPRKVAAERIMNDLLYSARGKAAQQDQAESTMSSVPSPPSLARYHRAKYAHVDDSVSIGMESSLESMLRRVGLNETLTQKNNILPTSNFRTPEQQRYDLLFGSGDTSELPQAQSLAQDGFNSDSSSDSFADNPDTHQPSAAFLMASQGRGGQDDSFGSSDQSSNDSIGEDQDDSGRGSGNLHPFSGMPQGDYVDDDSFDNLDEEGPEEETVFGRPPAERKLGPSQGGQRLQLLGGFQEDTEVVGDRIAAASIFSPTPNAPSR